MLERRSFLKTALVSLASLGTSSIPVWAVDEKKADEKKPEVKTSAPKVEVVFCLDTTGSMGGLLQGAKDKIWSICNQIVGGKPSPELKVGLVAFRDRGDQYVTKVFDLTEDLDAIHGHLKEFQAGGGGDGPESVNEALDVSVNKIKWSKFHNEDETLRIIFLVGDAPPHMDYKDDVKYAVSCEKACRMGIIINTIQCGNDGECTKFWQDISKKAEGQYVKIAQGGGVQVVAAPQDKRLAEINGELSKTTVAFGDAKAKGEAKEKDDAARALPAAAQADRALFNARKAQNAAYDLVDQVKQGKIKLEDVKKEELPEELQKLTLEERKKHLDELDKKRDALRKEALELDKQRTEFVNEKLAENKGKDGFDQQVLEMLRSQAKKAKIGY